MFNGLRQNSLFYILEKNDGITLKTGYVTAVSNPQPKYNSRQFTPTQPFGQTEMVVDVTVKVGDEILEYKQLPANASIANFGNNGIVVSESKEAMNAEIEGILRHSQQVIESVPFHEKNIKECEEVIKLLNPQMAKEKEHGEKIDKLEERMGGIEGTLSDMMGMLTGLVQKSVKVKKEE